MLNVRFFFNPLSFAFDYDVMTTPRTELGAEETVPTFRVGILIVFVYFLVGDREFPVTGFHRTRNFTSPTAATATEAQYQTFLQRAEEEKERPECYKWPL